jgi:hypothetical protein
LPSDRDSAHPEAQEPHSIEQGSWLAGHGFSPQSGIAPPRNAVVLDTQGTLGIENNGWGLLIAETVLRRDPLRSLAPTPFEGSVVSNQSELVSVDEMGKERTRLGLAKSN